MPASYFSFLCACFRNDLEAARKLVSDDHWNWESLLGRAKDELILPTIAESIRELNRAQAVPIEVIELLAAVEGFNAERNQVIVDELKAVCKLLNEHRIEPVLLKGAAYLATGIYPKPATRFLGDIDLLVSKDQIQSAAGILIRNGYQVDGSDHFGRFRHHHPPLRRRGSVFIELHSRLGMGPCASLLPAEEVLSQSEASDLNGLQARVPRPEHLVMHLIAHSQIQHSYHERIWPPLRAMYDLALMQRRLGPILDWKEIDVRFRQAGRFGVLALHALQLRETLGVELPLQLQTRGWMGLRWHRRRILRRFPVLRYVDPIYMSAVLLTRRIRVLRSMLRERNGGSHLAKQLLGSAVYRRFATDLIEGRGR
jgi:Uncharacterised nucleotidyltransferase